MKYQHDTNKYYKSLPYVAFEIGGKMMHSTNNPIAIQSKKWLTTALLDLMKDKPYDKITVKEIAEKADLNRSTFYRNFNTKEDVINYYLDYLTEEYIHRIGRSDKMDMSKVSRIFVEFWGENLEFVYSLRKNGLSYFLLEAFNTRLPYIHKSIQEKFSYKISEENLEFSLAFNAGGMWNLLMKWIDTGFVQSRTDLVKAFEEISNFNFIK